MLTKLITHCQSIHELYIAVSDLQPVGSLGGRDVRVMSADASDTISISLIANKFLELISAQSNFDEEHVDHQKTLDKIKSLDEDTFTALQGGYFEQNLQAYLSDPSVIGNKREAVYRIRSAFRDKRTDLVLSNLGLNTLPTALGQLMQLKTLDLSENKLTEVPATLGRLTQLTYLNLKENQLTSLPDALGRLTQLLTLILSANKLASLPDALGQLTQLQRLYLSENRLTSLPDTFGQLAQLRELTLQGNQLTSLPDTLGLLTQLQYLELSKNKLTSLPSILGHLTQLQHLYLSENQLTSLPAALGRLTQLRLFDLSENQLISLPAELGQLAHLDFLNLSKNQLISLPAELGQLAQLIELYLMENSNLQELPLALGSIPGLIRIDIEGTALDRQLVVEILRQCAAVRRAQGQIVLPHRLHTWKTAGNSQVDLSDIEKFTDDDKDTLNEWLTRLERANDFRGNLQPLAQTVCEMLHSMTQDEELRGIFLTFMEANNEINACEDRTAQALNELYTAWKLWQLPKDAPLSERLNVMIRAANTHALRAAIDQCIKEWERAERRPHLEAVEIQLFCELEIGKRIPLLSAIREMRYPQIGNKDWIKVDDLIKNVKDTYIDHLIELPSFAKVLADDQTFQEMWAPQESTFADQMDALDDVARTKDTQRITDNQYLSDVKMITDARKQKYKGMVSEWLKRAV